jgi:hypothetical protein
MDDNTPNPVSTAARPDLDWSQVRETILMLNLAIAQMEVAMHDSTGSVDVLTHSFTSMFGNMMGLVEAAQSLPDSPVKQSIQGLGANVTAEMQGAIVAFQFYDRLSQRLAHVSRSLAELTSIVSDSSRLYNPSAWHELQQQIRSKYTMEEEKLMFDTLLATGDVKKALEEFIARKHQEAGGSDDIELF